MKIAVTYSFGDHIMPYAKYDRISATTAIERLMTANLELSGKSDLFGCQRDTLVVLYGIEEFDEALQYVEHRIAGVS